MTSHDRNAAYAAVLRYTGAFEAEAPLITTEDLCSRLKKREKVILVDVRTAEEQAVSMLPGAVTREVFETDILPSLPQAHCISTEVDRSSQLIVPYCTVGHRSGLYCRELLSKHKLSNVRNGEGVIMWTFDGGPLVRPGERGRAPLLKESVAATCWEQEGNTDTATHELEHGEPVLEIHVYGRLWDFAAEGFTTVYFSDAKGAWHFLQSRCRGGNTAQVALWSFALGLWYFLFTPACGAMFNCGCQLMITKWAQVKHCNIYKAHETHKCPWCTCSGLSCLLVAFDSKALKNVPLLDMCPDGTFVTILTIGVLWFLWNRTDRSTFVKSVQPTRVAFGKAIMAIVWFFFYTVLMGLLFFLTSPDYPYFFGELRS